MVQPEHFDPARELGSFGEGAKESEASLAPALGLMVENGVGDVIQGPAGRREIRKSPGAVHQTALIAKVVNWRLPGTEFDILGAVWTQRFCDALEDQQRQAQEGWPGWVARLDHFGAVWVLSEWLLFVPVSQAGINSAGQEGFVLCLRSVLYMETQEMPDGKVGDALSGDGRGGRGGCLEDA
jgi:hypothetical protein